MRSRLGYPLDLKKHQGDDPRRIHFFRCKGPDLVLTRLNHSFSSLSMMISNTSYEIGPDWSFFRSALTVSSHSWSDRGDVSQSGARGP
jgi:hypothetical protein